MFSLCAYSWILSICWCDLKTRHIFLYQENTTSFWRAAVVINLFYNEREIRWRRMIFVSIKLFPRLLSRKFSFLYWLLLGLKILSFEVCPFGSYMDGTEKTSQWLLTLKNSTHLKKGTGYKAIKHLDVFTSVQSFSHQKINLFNARKWHASWAETGIKTEVLKAEKGHQKMARIKSDGRCPFTRKHFPKSSDEIKR